MFEYKLFVKTSYSKISIMGFEWKVLVCIFLKLSKN